MEKLWPLNDKAMLGLAEQGYVKHSDHGQIAFLLGPEELTRSVLRGALGTRNLRVFVTESHHILNAGETY